MIVLYQEEAWVGTCVADSGGKVRVQTATLPKWDPYTLALRRYRHSLPLERTLDLTQPLGLDLVY